MPPKFRRQARTGGRRPSHFEVAQFCCSAFILASASRSFSHCVHGVKAIFGTLFPFLPFFLLLQESRPKLSCEENTRTGDAAARIKFPHAQRRRRRERAERLRLRKRNVHFGRTEREAFRRRRRRRVKFRRRHGKMGGGAPGMADDGRAKTIEIGRTGTH